MYGQTGFLIRGSCSFIWCSSKASNILGPLLAEGEPTVVLKIRAISPRYSFEKLSTWIFVANIFKTPNKNFNDGLNLVITKLWSTLYKKLGATDPRGTRTPWLRPRLTLYITLLFSHLVHELRDLWIFNKTEESVRFCFIRVVKVGFWRVLQYFVGSLSFFPGLVHWCTWSGLPCLIILWVWSFCLTSFFILCSTSLSRTTLYFSIKSFEI